MDIFSFAMVMIEVRHGEHTMRGTLANYCFISIQVFTGVIPFNDISYLAATSAIVKGIRPPRPTHPTFTDCLWTLMQSCWDQNPRTRPTISEVVLQVLVLSVCNHFTHHLAENERVSLIETILVGGDPVAMAGYFSQGDAQTLIDVMDEVSSTWFPH